MTEPAAGLGDAARRDVPAAASTAETARVVPAITAAPDSGDRLVTEPTSLRQLAEDTRSPRQKKLDAAALKFGERLAQRDSRLANAEKQLILLGQTGKEWVADRMDAIKKGGAALLSVGVAGGVGWAWGSEILSGIGTAVVSPAAPWVAGALAAPGILYAGEAGFARLFYKAANKLNTRRLNRLRGESHSATVAEGIARFIANQDNMKPEDIPKLISECAPQNVRYLEEKIAYNNQRIETMGIFRTGIRAGIRKEGFHDRRDRKAKQKITKERLTKMRKELRA